MLGRRRRRRGARGFPCTRLQISWSIFAPEIFSRAPAVRRPIARNKHTATAVPLEQQKSGGEGRGARRRGGVERGVKLRLGERLMDLPGGGQRKSKDGGRRRNSGGAPGV